VTHTGNGRSVVVRVNDRGPFLHGRVIDLSYTAAAKLGYIEAGSAEVDVQLITQFDGADAPVATAATANVAATNVAARTWRRRMLPRPVRPRLRRPNRCA